MRASDKAWLALGSSVAVYELVAKDGEMLSHSYDRWLTKRPILTWTCTLITAAHLLNVLPMRADPFVWGYKWKLVRRG